MSESPLEYIKPRYSFSGADCRVYICPHGKYELFTPLESMNTISYSVHEQKGHARALGYKAAKGFARGVRTVAGSLIMTVIEDNPFAPFLKAMEIAGGLVPKGWSQDAWQTGTGSYMGDDASYYRYRNMLPTLIPPLDILLVFANESDSGRTSVRTVDTENADSSVEYTSGLKAVVTDALIEGVEFVDFGQVMSIHDIVTEINASWVARNVMPLTQEPPRTDVVFTEDIWGNRGGPTVEVGLGESDDE